MAMKPIITWHTFVEAHNDFDARLKKFSVTKRGRNVPPDLFNALAEREARSLHAMNALSRIEFCRAARRRIGRAVRPTQRRPAYFVTLAPDRFAMPLSDAASYDWSELQEWVRRLLRVLRGLDYIGVVDAALYTNSPRYDRGRAVAWHMHLLVWNCSAAQIRNLCLYVNTRYRSLVPGLTPAHSRPLTTRKAVTRQITYAFKAPTRSYRFYPRRDEQRRITDTWQQKKYPARPGEAVEICKFMRGARIDQLCLSGGQAVGMIDEIAEMARRAVDGKRGRNVLQLVRCLLAPRE